MKLLKLTVPALVLIAGLGLTSVHSFAKMEYSKKEKTGCVTCHVGAGKKELNATGNCYKDKKSLEGCEVKK